MIEIQRLIYPLHVYHSPTAWKRGYVNCRVDRSSYWRLTVAGDEITAAPRLKSA